MRRVLIAVVAAALCACGSSSNSGGGGGAGNTSTAAFVIQPSSCAVQGFNVSAAGVVVAAADRSFSDACGTASNVCSVSYKNLTTLEMAIIKVDLAGGTATAVGPGTYPINSVPTNGAIVTASESKTDASCATAAPLEADSGSITLTGVGSTITGSYDLTMHDQTKRTGTINSSACSSALPGGGTFCDVLNGGGGPSCTGTPTCQ